MPYFDQVQRCSFGSVEFPVDMIEIRGGIRHHVHEFPHADGGAPEKLGRKLYVVRLHAVFDESIAAYPNNYPDSLFTLRSKIASGQSGPLTLPNIGTMNAYCPDFTHRWTAAVRSGETADFEFIEDPGVIELDGFEIPDTVAMFVQLDHMNLEAAAAAARLAAQQAATVTEGTLDLTQCSVVDPNAVSGLTSAFTDLARLRGELDFAGQVLSQKVAAITQYANAIDRTITSPLDIGLLQSVVQLQQTATQLANNAKNKVAPYKTWIVPRLMSVTEISAALYGDTSHAMDLLQLNPIDNAFAVAAGTQIRYLDTTKRSNVSVGTPPAVLQAA